ncbi:MAG: amino acid permease, partial [Proteobacteria bacterium]|nr:amino acid permease [Pseudomonadota bacterium]
RTAAKVVLIVVFILGGLIVGHGDWGNLASEHGGLANMGTMGFATALMYVSFAYSGWNAAAYIASDIKDPQRTLPRALLLGTGAVMVLYVLLNLVFFYAAPSSKLAGVGEVGDLAARSLFGDRAGQLVTAMISLALVSSVSAMIMAGPRVYAAMAADRALPKSLAFHNKRGVPTVAILWQAGLGIAFVLIGDLGSLIRFVGFTLAIFAALTVGALFIMRKRGLESPYRTWGYPVTPILFIALSAWIAYAQLESNPKEAAIGFGVLLVGGLVYVVAGRNRTPPPSALGPADLPEARVVSTDN